MSRLKRLVYPIVDPILRGFGRPAIRDKTDSVDELVKVYPKERYNEVRDALKKSQFHRHTWFSTLKYVEVDGQRYYESSSWVYWPNGIGSENQIHVYLIIVGDKLRVYAHKEKSIFRPMKHQDSEFQIPGDPDGKVTPILP